MSDTTPAPLASDVTAAKPKWRALAGPGHARGRVWVVWIVIATLAFAQPLVRLTRHALDSELLSYIPLVPLVTCWLLYLRRHKLAPAYRSSVMLAVAFGLLAAGTLAAAVTLRGRLSVNDDLALLTLAYVSVVIAGGFLFLGWKWMASAAFPMAFLAFMVPLPDVVVYELEMASVYASADVSAAFFRATGTPLLRDGTVFALPGIVLRVAQECSGIHSSWVLFMTSLVAAHLYLESPWRRLILVAFVIPLAIIRNSFRILVIGLLCVHVGPHMIDSLIHRQGGPIFFALSLVPLFLLLAWLRRSER